MKSKSDHKEHKINDEISGESVRLISDGDPIVISLKDALKSAEDANLDLVELSMAADMPIVKIMDYSKFRFEQLKKAKDAKKKQKVVHIKEVKIRPSVGDHDYEHKIKHAREFLEKGDKVKFTMVFRGREIVHTELGMNILNDILEDLKEISVVEKKPSHEGRNMTMILSPGLVGKKIK